MAKISRRMHNYSDTPRSVSIPLAIFKGVIVSITSSLVFALFFALISMVSDSNYIDKYLEYIVVAITLTSIFIGSVYATQQIESKGLIIGITVGLIYVLFSVGIGMELGQEPVSLLVLGNKLAAGILAGALGGFIGVNL
ncbi:MAG TPA: TIGR04086 family membrane protein [Methylomusa anaerophila]|uniref:Membrane protein, TIGR04086 family n=1 Tax=Methylomusa anaerophila TaxID=1930071 RepID=A0A348APR7_9FIRM|nr:TIGR04086 family membrane protein [Methylomusa anaerophila]BBB93065.1 hypothetical protein MAMMFC1_03774 [Methylomusa anaerophila]HML87102.1 TIGR04086 family membrane protein [Methylomusa anaerophila]